MRKGVYMKPKKDGDQDEDASEPEASDGVTTLTFPSNAVVSGCPPLMITKDMHTALMTHAKTATRRNNKMPWTNAHTNAFKSGHIVRVWSRPDAGSLYGRLAGHCKYTKVYQQMLSDMTRADVRAEGFADWTVARFIENKFLGLHINTKVWVFEFDFFPLCAQN